MSFKMLQLNKIKVLLDDTGLEVCCISSPFFKCDIDNEAEVKENIRILEKCVQLAHFSGTKLIKSFTFWRKGSFDDRVAGLLPALRNR